CWEETCELFERWRPMQSSRGGHGRYCAIRGGTGRTHRWSRRKAAVSALRSVIDEWSGRQDSNLRPSAPKADALPGCATPRHALRYTLGPQPSSGERALPHAAAARALFLVDEAA